MKHLESRTRDEQRCMTRSFLRGFLQGAAAISVAAALHGCTVSSGDGIHSKSAGQKGTCSTQLAGHGERLDCGADVKLCGVLVLETGRGSGHYRHKHPVVHGLWPQTGQYGNSKCVAPRRSTPPSKVFACYDQEGESHSSNLGFQRHEWEKHGTCAGAADADDFLSQVCALSREPLRVMDGARAANLDMADTAEALRRAGFCVYRLGTQKQLELSACAGADGRWKLAAVSQFSAVCGHGVRRPVAPHEQQRLRHSSSNASTTRTCVPGKHGPPCDGDRDCGGAKGCARCAHSGYCTDVPLQ